MQVTTIADEYVIIPGRLLKYQDHTRRVIAFIIDSHQVEAVNFRMRMSQTNLQQGYINCAPKTRSYLWILHTFGVMGLTSSYSYCYQEEEQLNAGVIQVAIEEVINTFQVAAY